MIFSSHFNLEKELNKWRQTLKPLENKGFFRLSLLYRNGIAAPVCSMPMAWAWRRFRSGWGTATSARQATFIHIWISPVRYLRRMQSSISSQKTPKYKKWAKKKNSLKSFVPKLFYDEVPMVGLEPTWFPERFWVVCVCHSATSAYIQFWDISTGFWRLEGCSGGM